MQTLSLLILTVIAGGAPDSEAESLDIRATVQRSIPFIEEKGVWWINEKKCVTCHRTGNMVWALGAARQKGFAVSGKLDEWLDWSIENSLETKEGKVSGSGNLDGLAQLILAAPLFNEEGRHESYQRFVSLMVQGQQSDGTWKPGGQLPSQKRPAGETTDVSVMWISLALASDTREGEHREALTKALQHLEASSPGKSTEWYAARLLLAVRLKEAERAAALIQKLREQQRDDGGWGWIVGEDSDALGTGISLYALLQAGVDRDDPVIRRGQQFLVRSQRDDGSWAVRGTKANKKDRIEETAVYWGTAWAALALAESLPQ